MISELSLYLHYQGKWVRLDRVFYDDLIVSFELDEGLLTVTSTLEPENDIKLRVNNDLRRANPVRYYASLSCTFGTKEGWKNCKEDLIQRGFKLASEGDSYENDQPIATKEAAS